MDEKMKELSQVLPSEIEARSFEILFVYRISIKPLLVRIELYLGRNHRKKGIDK